MVVFGDGDVEQNYGLFGGKGSVLNSIRLTYPNGEKHTPLSKDIIEEIPANTIYRQIAGGGGGYGNPLERDLGKVVEDIHNQVVDKEQAENDYGVVLTDGMEIDLEKTKELRENN